MIIQPLEDIKLPDDIVVKLERVRNQISIGEAEVSRLTKLIQSQQYTVNQSVLQLKELEDKITQSTKELDALSAKAITDSITCNVLSEKKVELERDIENRLLEAKIRENEITSKEIELNALNTQITADNISLQADIQAFNEEKANHQIKVEKLTQVLNEL